MAKAPKTAKVHYHPPKRAPLAACGAAADSQNVTSEKDKVTCLKCKKMHFIR